MEIQLCVVVATLVTGIVCTHIQGHIEFEMSSLLSGLTCSAADQIGDVIPTQTRVICTCECARTEGCKSVFYTNASCARCRSRYKEAADPRLTPMQASVSYKTGFVLNNVFKVCIVKTKNYCSTCSFVYRMYC
ncbi:hypothetical protein DPMN_050669 [Dreissena polymorpha]|uniref:Uncharacterized protein n=1 Tax=Dreissena polymorpha TaxID=45954 RepID=A0A9D4HLI3_DREPO|nr:hypothetical protein DPMN_050669 [Dreissena polymorpha]